MSFHYLLASIMFVEKLAVSIIVGPFKKAGVSKLSPCPLIYVLPVSDFTAMVEVSRYIRNNMTYSAYSIYYLALYWKDVLTCSSRKCFFLCMLLRFSFSLIFSSLTMLYLVQFSWFLSHFLKVLKMWVHVFHQFGRIISCYLLKYCFCPIFSSLSSVFGTLIRGMLYIFSISHISLMLCSVFHSFISWLFELCIFSWAAF